ncbi:MAG: DUF1840 domain-containing protein [Azoarcus sp.]|jgi:hypothetical protein|nr:DUF1840 domain-containing protein [Azoarcus sp.]
MLTAFRSKAGFDVLMFGDTAKELLTLFGKSSDDPQGIITTEQMPNAIARLEAAVDAERARQNAKTTDERDAEEEADIEAGNVGMAASVNFAQRAWPLLDLLRRSHAAGEPVLWDAQ